MAWLGRGSSPGRGIHPLAGLCACVCVCDRASPPAGRREGSPRVWGAPSVAGVAPLAAGFAPWLGAHSVPGGVHPLAVEFTLWLRSHPWLRDSLHGWGRGSHPCWGLTIPCPAGRDATRAFASGDFTPAGLVDDVSGLSPSELLSIHSWLSFYSDNYDPVGGCRGGWVSRGGLTQGTRRWMVGGRGHSARFHLQGATMVRVSQLCPAS